MMSGSLVGAGSGLGGTGSTGSGGIVTVGVGSGSGVVVATGTGIGIGGVGTDFLSLRSISHPPTRSLTLVSTGQINEAAANATKIISAIVSQIGRVGAT